MKLPRISGEKVLKVLKGMGYEEIRIRGSHHHLLSGTGSLITVPVHAGKTIAPQIMSVDTPGSRYNPERVRKKTLKRFV